MKGERSSVASAAKKTLASGNVLHLYLGRQILTAGVYEKLLTKLKKNKALIVHQPIHMNKAILVQFINI